MPGKGRGVFLYGLEYAGLLVFFLGRSVWFECVECLFGKAFTQCAVFQVSGNPIITIKHSFQDACKKASIKDFRFHDLRHTFNTNMRKAGVDRSVIMKITGHKTMSMFERYNTVDSDDARSAMTQFEKHLQDKVTAILLQGTIDEKNKGQLIQLTP